ncbi:hypothetical protein Tco_1157642 [Tanacetum coccineum]
MEKNLLVFNDALRCFPFSQAEQVLSFEKCDEIGKASYKFLPFRKLVMNRLGQLLRNFRRKLRQTFILPNQNTLSKLNEVPTKYSAILQAKEWVNFVKYSATEEYKVKSAAAKMARSKSVYQHTMGRGGYALVKGKMNKNFHEASYADDVFCGV